MHLIVSATRNNNQKLAGKLEATAKELGMEVQSICLEDYDWKRRGSRQMQLS